MNRDGDPQTLVPALPATRIASSMVFTQNCEIAPEVRDLADELMRLPHVAGTDYAAALEIA